MGSNAPVACIDRKFSNSIFVGIFDTLLRDTVRATSTDVACICAAGRGSGAHEAADDFNSRLVARVPSRAHEHGEEQCNEQVILEQHFVLV